MEIQENYERMYLVVADWNFNGITEEVQVTSDAAGIVKFTSAKVPSGTSLTLTIKTADGILVTQEINKNPVTILIP